MDKTIRTLYQKIKHIGETIPELPTVMFITKEELTSSLKDKGAFDKKYVKLLRRQIENIQDELSLVNDKLHDAWTYLDELEDEFVDEE